MDVLGCAWNFRMRIVFDARKFGASFNSAVHQVRGRRNILQDLAYSAIPAGAKGSPRMTFLSICRPPFACQVAHKH